MSRVRRWKYKYPVERNRLTTSNGHPGAAAAADLASATGSVWLSKAHWSGSSPLMLDRGLQGIQSRLLTQYLAAGIARQVTSAAQKLQLLYFLPSEPFKWRVQYNLSFLEHLSPWNSPSPRQALGNDSWETSKGVGGVRFSSYVSLSTARNPMPAPVDWTAKAWACSGKAKLIQ